MYTLPPSRSAAAARPAVTLVPIVDSIRPELDRLAAGDGHAVIHPTHAVMRGAEVVGYASIGAVPMFFAWLDSKKLSAGESFRAWRQAEEIATADQRGTLCLPCTADSPLLPFVRRMGYRKIGTAHIHLKEF